MGETHEVGEALPFEFDRSRMAALCGEPGEPLLRARLAAGSRSLLAGGAEALAMELKWCREMCGSTVRARRRGCEALEMRRRLVVLVKRSLDRRALQLCSRSTFLR